VENLRKTNLALAQRLPHAIGGRHDAGADQYGAIRSPQGRGVLLVRVAPLRAELPIRHETAPRRSADRPDYRGSVDGAAGRFAARASVLMFELVSASVPPRMASDPKSPKETTLEVENTDLRNLLTQAGIDAARLLAKAGIDATENEAAKRVQQLLLEELHHRVKNTLATVIAITSRSLRAAETLEQGRIAVESRLVALGRAHDVLLQAQWTRAKLIDVIHSAIEPFESRDGQRFIVQDISIDVGSGAVLPLTMALNELCTNALKYGALSNDTGHVEIASTVDDTMLRLTWTEKGGPLIRAPSRLSFGSRLIGQLAAQLHGEVRIKYEPAGLVCELDVPMSALREPHAR